MQHIVWQPKLWNLPYLISKVSKDVFNIWLVTHINLYFILIILMMDKMSSGLHGLVIKLKTTQPKMVQNVIKMQTMPELSTEDDHFWVLFTLYLVLLSAGKYRLSQIQHLNPLMEKLDACTNLLRKIQLSGDTWKIYHSTQVHLQCIGRITQVVSLFFKLKDLLLELNTLISPSVFYKNNLTMVSFYQNMISPVSCRKICAQNHVHVL